MDRSGGRRQADLGCSTNGEEVRSHVFSSSLGAGRLLSLPNSEQALLCGSGTARTQQVVIAQKSPQTSHSQLFSDRFLRRAQWTYVRQNRVGKR